jgi:hypothetical protein
LVQFSDDFIAIIVEELGPGDGFDQSCGVLKERITLKTMIAYLDELLNTLLLRLLLLGKLICRLKRLETLKWLRLLPEHVEIPLKMFEIKSGESKVRAMGQISFG